MKTLFILFLVLLLCSCVPTGFIVVHDYNLVNEGSLDKKNTYSDSLITITFSPRPSSYKISLINNTDQPIYINWEETSFIHDGIAGPVINKDVDYYDKSLPVKPTLVPPLMKRVDKLIPVENIVIDASGARLNPIVREFSTTEKVRAKHLAGKSKTQGIYMTLNTGSGSVAYSFAFKGKGRIVEKDPEIIHDFSPTFTSLVFSGIIIVLAYFGSY